MPLKQVKAPVRILRAAAWIVGSLAGNRLAGKLIRDQLSVDGEEPRPQQKNCSSNNTRGRITSCRWPSVVQLPVLHTHTDSSMTGRYISTHTHCFTCYLTHTHTHTHTHTLCSPSSNCGGVILIEILQGDPRQASMCQSRPKHTLQTSPQTWTHTHTHTHTAVSVTRMYQYQYFIKTAL